MQTSSVEGAQKLLSCKSDQPLSTIVCPKQRKRKVRPRGRPSPRLERPVRNSIGSGEQLSACAGSLINWAVAAAVYAPDQDLKAKKPGETIESIESSTNLPVKSKVKVRDSSVMKCAFFT